MGTKSSIKRPIVALVVLLVIALGVGIGVLGLAVWQYMQAPLPTLVVSASYPGANAQRVAEAVGEPIEREVSGVEDMVSMSRECTDNGDYRLTLTFRRCTDLEVAQVVVQNRVSLAAPRLPDVVNRDGVRVIRQPAR